MPRTRSAVAGLLACGIAVFGGRAAAATAPLSPALAHSLGASEVHAWVFFRDKALSPADEALALARTEAALPGRTLWRRSKTMRLRQVDALDLPVSDRYVSQVLATGVRRRATTRWLNGISVEATPWQLRQIAALPCVERLDLVASRRREPLPRLEPGADALRFPARAPAGRPARPGGIGALDSTQYGASWPQLQAVQIPLLHDLGYHGEGILICMLDNGFHLFHEVFNYPGHPIQVAHSRDFIHGDTVVANEPGQDGFGQDIHGTWTTSLIGGYYPGHFLGAAYNARFLLGKTEDNASETEVEEDYWMMGAEWADSLGADIISSSLGYRFFDDTLYHFSQLDGRQTPITRAASIAVSRGILVVNAMGNEGTNSDQYPDPFDKMLAPADGDSVLSVGAVFPNGRRANYSSIGPTYDRRIKPDIMAPGSGVVVPDPIDTTSYTGSASGTSFSTPITAGAAALILQKHPSYTPLDVMEAIRQTGDRAFNPDTLFGWGVLHAYDAAYAILNSPDSGQVLPPGAAPVVRLFANRPNPFHNVTLINFSIEAGTSLVTTRVRIYDPQGRLVNTLLDSEVNSGIHQVSWNGTRSGGQPAATGIYFCRLDAAGAVVTRPILYFH